MMWLFLLLAFAGGIGVWELACRLLKRFASAPPVVPVQEVDEDGEYLSGMKIAVLNKSTLVTDDEVQKMVDAVRAQVKRDVCPTWGLRLTTVKRYASEASVPAGSIKVVVFDDADQAGALGYHDDGPDGLPYGRVFAKDTLNDGGTKLDGTLSVASVLSHEVLEIIGDPQVNVWADGPDGVSYAYELCDAVESDSYEMLLADGTKVSVSNFVLPAWFDPIPPAGSKYDFLGKLSKPFTMTKGGYLIVRTEGNVSQRYGEEYPESKKASKKHAAARTQRRQ